MLRDVAVGGNAPRTPETKDIYTPAVWKSLKSHFYEVLGEIEERFGVRKGQLTITGQGQAGPDLLSNEAFLEGKVQTIEFHLIGRFDLKTKRHVSTDENGKSIAYKAQVDKTNQYYEQFKKTSGVDPYELMAGCFEPHPGRTVEVYSHNDWPTRSAKAVLNSRVFIAYTLDKDTTKWKGGTKGAWFVHKRASLGVERHYCITDIS